MESNERFLLLCFVFASGLLSAEVSVCSKRKSSATAPSLHLGTAIAQSGLATFALYLQVSAGTKLSSQSTLLPVETCPFGKLGNVSWPPMAVCWAPLVSHQHTGTSVHDEADLPLLVDPVETFDFNTGMLSSLIFATQLVQPEVYTLVHSTLFTVKLYHVYSLSAVNLLPCC